MTTCQEVLTDAECARTENGERLEAARAQAEMLALRARDAFAERRYDDARTVLDALVYTSGEVLEAQADYDAATSYLHGLRRLQLDQAKERKA